MRVVKRINHNAALLVNDKGTELVALGKALVFLTAPMRFRLRRLSARFTTLMRAICHFLTRSIPR